MMNQQDPVVIDNGSGMCKAGLSGDDAPRCDFPSIVGVPRYSSLSGMNLKQFYVGQEAQAKKGILKLQNSIQYDQSVNWEEMSKVWHHCFFNQLRVHPQHHPCLLTDSLKNPKQNRENTTRIMFEEFCVPQFYMHNQSVLCLYASGRTTGTVLNCGQSVTEVVPICQGYAISDCAERYNLGGRDLTKYLKQLLKQIGIDFIDFSSEAENFKKVFHEMKAILSNSAESKSLGKLLGQIDYNFLTSIQSVIVKEIKEKLCYVAYSFEEQKNKYQQPGSQSSYQLPDGQTISVGDIKFRCPEALFRPKIIAKDMPGFHEILHQAIIKCGSEYHSHLYENILVSGGTTLFPGFPEKLSKKTKQLVDKTVKIISPPERKYLAFIGGAILSSLSTFKEMWISKVEYEENGPTIVHKKCP